MSGICCQRCLKAPCVCDTAPQPPPNYFCADVDQHQKACDRIAALEASRALLRDERDRAIERHNVAQETISVLRLELSTAEREAEEARERLAMAERNGELAVGDLLIVASALAQQKCQCVTTLGAHARCDRCAAMDATAASVAQHTAEVERRGAAKELRAMAEELEAKAAGGAGVLAYRISASKCRVRAAELEGA